MYIELLKYGGEFYRSKKFVREYDDTKNNRLTFIVPRTNFRNMRNGYIRNLKKNLFPIIMHAPIILFTNVLKIYIYNRLINRGNSLTFKNFLSFLSLPLPQKTILQIKNFYDYKNNLFGINRE